MKTLSPIFQDGIDNEIWLEGAPLQADEHILVTMRSASGEQSAYISSHGVTEIQADQLVDSAPDVQTEESKRKHAGFQKAMTISGYSIAIVLLLFSGLSFGGVVKARIVLTGSMEPAISAGDIIITTPITRKEPQIGDVVVLGVAV